MAEKTIDRSNEYVRIESVTKRFGARVVVDAVDLAGTHRPGGRGHREPDGRILGEEVPDDGALADPGRAREDEERGQGASLLLAEGLEERGALVGAHPSESSVVGDLELGHREIGRAHV